MKYTCAFIYLFIFQQAIKCGNLEIAKWTWSQYDFGRFCEAKFRCIPMLQWANSTGKLEVSDYCLYTADIEVLQWVYDNGLWDDDKAVSAATQAALIGNNSWT